MLRLVLKLALVDLIHKLSMVVVFTLNSHMSQREIKYAQPLRQGQCRMGLAFYPVHTQDWGWVVGDRDKVTVPNSGLGSI